eukprot:139211-Rhodomonas_salina.5
MSVALFEILIAWGSLQAVIAPGSDSRFHMQKAVPGTDTAHRFQSQAMPATSVRSTHCPDNGRAEFYVTSRHCTPRLVERKEGAGISQRAEAGV